MSFKQTTFGRSTLTTSQELDRAQERADKTAADLRRTEAELRVTRVSVKIPCSLAVVVAIVVVVFYKINALPKLNRNKSLNWPNFSKLINIIEQKLVQYKTVI